MIALDRLDNDLAGWIERHLVRTGALPATAFEATFTALVTASAPDPMDAWTAFYANTLARLDDPGRESGEGTIAEFGPIHRQARDLALGTDVVELGCCFGFLALRLAAAGHRVTALDLSVGTVGLLRSVAARLDVAVQVLAGDATAPPLADHSADTVFAVHLLEHLPADAGERALAHMRRVARRRVVVAVPFEDEPNPTWGHVRTFDLAALRRLGRDSGWRHRVFARNGGWLVLDRD